MMLEDVNPSRYPPGVEEARKFCVWVDADACPGAVKDMVVRACLKHSVDAVFVANKDIQLPSSPHLKAIRVPKGPDVVDAYIAEQGRSGDLAITQDIPLAAQLVARGVATISPYGETFTDDSVGERLSIRNFMHDLREEGVRTSGPAPFGPVQRQRFANAFDRILSRARRGG